LPLDQAVRMTRDVRSLGMSQHPDLESRFGRRYELGAKRSRSRSHHERERYAVRSDAFSAHVLDVGGILPCASKCHLICPSYNNLTRKPRPSERLQSDE
jgi:hypothetical protein